MNRTYLRFGPWALAVAAFAAAGYGQRHAFAERPNAPARIWRPAPDLGTLPTRARAVRFPDTDGIGLPEDARVNAAMFQGVTLTSEQGRRIAELSAQFAIERESYLGPNIRRGHLDGAMRERLAPFLERQRLSYRAVLTPAQHGNFDANVRRVMAAWDRQPAQSRAASRPSSRRFQ